MGGAVGKGQIFLLFRLYQLLLKYLVVFFSKMPDITTVSPIEISNSSQHFKKLKNNLKKVAQNVDKPCFL